MKKLLFVKACVNRETSRAHRLSRELIALLNKNRGLDLCELVLENENIQALTSETLNNRFELLKKRDFSNDAFSFANQFKDADCIVIGTPYWDFGFPSILKAFIEAISVPGIVFRYGEGGRPEGLCKAEKLYYVTTRGGYIGDEKDLGFATMV